MDTPNSEKKINLYLPISLPDGREEILRSLVNDATKKSKKANEELREKLIEKNVKLQTLQDYGTLLENDINGRKKHLHRILLPRDKNYKIVDVLKIVSIDRDEKYHDRIILKLRL